MKNLEENSALQTRNAELIRNALPSMPEPVKRFLAELGKKISPEMYADILNLDISLLSKVLFGLKFLSPEEQILLPTMSPSDLQNLFVNLATAHYQLITPPLALPATQSTSPRIQEVINPQTGHWEYLFLRNGLLPDRGKPFEHEGYTYTWLKKGPEGWFFSRKRSDSSAAISRDFSDELRLKDYFASLVHNYGGELTIKQSDLSAVKHLILLHKLEEAFDKINLFLQGIFISAWDQARGDQEKRKAIEVDWKKFCDACRASQSDGGPQLQHLPLLDFSNYEEVLANFHAVKASSSVLTYAVEVEQSGNSAPVHRADPDIELIDGIAYVRIYQTVYAVSYGQKYKDIIQEANGKVKVINAGDKMWINMGWPLRAFHYVRTYQAQGIEKRAEALAKLNPHSATYQAEKERIEFLHGLPVIRLFLIPKDFHDEYTLQAISESQVAELGENHTLNVDKAKAPNQYGVTTADEALINDHILQGSLVSYVQDGEERRYQDPRNGTVLPISILEQQLGLPTWDNPFMLKMQGTKVPKEDRQKENAEKLAELYTLTCQCLDSENYLWAFDNSSEEFTAFKNMWNKLATPYGVSFPTSLDQLLQIKDQIEKAATFSLIPSLIRENYEEARERVHMVGKSQRTGERISLWTEMQNFTIIRYPAIRSKMPTNSTLTDESVHKHLGATCNPLIEVLINYLSSAELNQKDFDQSSDEVEALLAYILYLATKDHIHGSEVSNEKELEFYKRILFERITGQVERPKPSFIPPEPKTLLDTPLKPENRQILETILKDPTCLSRKLLLIHLKEILDAVPPLNLEATKLLVLGIVNQGIRAKVQHLRALLKPDELDAAAYKKIDDFLQNVGNSESLEEAATQSSQIEALVDIIKSAPKDRKGREYNRYSKSLEEKIKNIVG